jgi:NAD(P)-dependent dehydrogenase (short-subunit alcohol dehydrogenase family)
LLDAAVSKATVRSGRDPKLIRSAFASDNAHLRLLTPEEVAQAVVRLCLPVSGSITGEAITITGEAA